MVRWQYEEYGTITWVNVEAPTEDFSTDFLVGLVLVLWLGYLATSEGSGKWKQRFTILSTSKPTHHWMPS